MRADIVPENRSLAIPVIYMVGEVGLEPTKAKPADLQSAPFAAQVALLPLAGEGGGECRRVTDYGDSALNYCLKIGRCAGKTGRRTLR
jgi:hypothetical protein